MDNDIIYLDNAATTKICPEALSAMLPWLTEHYGNASAVNKFGIEASKAVKKATEQCAAVLDCKADEIFFTSGATESNNWAIKSAAELGARKGKRHIITSAIEHHSVLRPLETLERQGFEVTYLPVDNKGIIKLEDLEAAIRKDTALVSIMAVNNEIGTIQPIRKASEICHKHGAIFHTDATQAIGHVLIDIDFLNVDMLSLSAHKFHGPKGTGILFIKNSLDLPSFIEGGSQQRGKRAGTENVAGIVGTACALQNSVTNSYNLSQWALHDKLTAGLLQIEGISLNCSGRQKIPEICNFTFKGINAEALMLELELRGVIVSAGSACSAGSLNSSHVLKAIGLSDSDALSSLRFSLSQYTTEKDIDRVLEIVPAAVEKIRKYSK